MNQRGQTKIEFFFLPFFWERSKFNFFFFISTTEAEKHMQKNGLIIQKKINTEDATCVLTVVMTNQNLELAKIERKIIFDEC